MILFNITTTLASHKQPPSSSYDRMYDHIGFLEMAVFKINTFQNNNLKSKKTSL